jgi:small subunit ribosomal protein S21
LADVVAKDNENFENLLKRFNRSVQQEGILSEVRHREYYEKPSVKRKRREVSRKRKSARVSRK